MTQSLPDLTDLTNLEPAEARILMRARERSREIVHQYAPTSVEEGRKQPISPLATIKVEALAHLIALTNLHQAGARHHESNGNTRQQLLWERDTEALASLSAALFIIDVR